MGLNLKINRLIFTTLLKNTSQNNRAIIDNNEIKQISGRSGRYMENGKIACMRVNDLYIVKEALKNVNKTTIKPNIDSFDDDFSDEEIEISPMIIENLETNYSIKTKEIMNKK